MPLRFSGRIPAERKGCVSRRGRRGLLAGSVAWLVALALVVPGGTSLSQDGGNAAPARSSPPIVTPVHKVRVSRPDLGTKVLALGGRLVADYGAYQFFEIDSLPAELLRNSEIEIKDQDNLVRLNTGVLDTTRPQVRALRRMAGELAGKRLHLVHFAGPIQPAWQRGLVSSGVEVVTYIPHNAYLVYGDAPSLGRLQAAAASAPEIQWDGPFENAYKLHPAIQSAKSSGDPQTPAGDEFAVQLVADSEANALTLAWLEQVRLEPIRQQSRVLNYLNLVVRLASADLPQLTARPDVISVQPHFRPRKVCERQSQIIAGNLAGSVPAGPGYLAWLAGKGLTQEQFAASGFAVDLSDSGIDTGTLEPSHPGLRVGGSPAGPSRLVYSRLAGTPNAGSSLAGCDGHGTLNAHIVAGYNDAGGFPHTDAAGFHYGLGVCPFVALGASVIFDPDYFTRPDYNELQSSAYESGARISNNSWGDSGFGVYDIKAQNYDALVRDAQPANAAFARPGNQEMVIVFAAGNDGPQPQTINPPATAKNVLTVGAAESVQAFDGMDSSGITDASADSTEDVASFSSQGPCADGRRKPDLVAPGTHVSGGVVQASLPGADGAADPCFLANGQGISGGPLDSGSFPFFPEGQQFYTASSGTSHAAPAVSGACALLRQYFLNQYGYPPSPAMTKAALLNSARYLTGAFANDDLWSGAQGMGGLDLRLALDETPRVLRDQLAPDLFTASGQQRLFTGRIVNTNQPFRVTLAWTDAPGTTAGSAFNNDLDLAVTIGGNTYKGNVFQGALSVTGGSADAVNNVESVLLPTGLFGAFVVAVTAANINSDGVPQNDSPLDQDFALVIYNAESTALPILDHAGFGLVAESCLPPNGAVDPGEIVTLDLALRNVGTADTTNLVATLLPDANVVGPSAPQTYGALPVGSGPVSRPFTFAAVGVCGEPLVATLALTDGATDLGQVQFRLQFGKTAAPSFSENFDDLVPPALSDGWTTALSGAGPDWATTAAISDTPPLAVFIAEPDLPGRANLVSPVIPITSPSARLTFRHHFVAEADPLVPSLGYDGGVLEIKIGNGVFADILAAGGTFNTGGYTRALDDSLSGDNPLAGRNAWSGNSGGFILTSVNLPATAANQPVQFQWSFGTDTGNYYGGLGWFIDTVQIEDAEVHCCNASVTPPWIAVGPSNQTTVAGNDIAFQVSALGTPPLHYQWRFNGHELPGDTQTALLLTQVQPDRMGDYSVLVTNAAGAVTSAVARLTVLVPPRITGVAFSPEGLRINLNSLSGLTYQLEYKSSWTEPAWKPLLPAVPGTGAMISLTDTNAPFDQGRFYRVQCR